MSEVFQKNFFKMAVAIAIVLAFIYIQIPFLIPVLLGGILAMAFSPFLTLFERWGWNRKLSVFLITFSLFITGVLPLGLIISKEAKVIVTFFSEEPFLRDKIIIEAKIDKILEHFSDNLKMNPELVRSKFDTLLASFESFILDKMSSTMSQIPNLLMLSLITFFSFYVFLLEEIKIRKWFDHYFYFSKEGGDKFISIVKKSCREVFFSNVITGLVQASVITAGAYFCKIGESLIIFTITFFLSFIPTGAAPFGFLLGLVAILDHRLGTGIAMAIIAAVSGIIDNIIRPYLNSLGNVHVPLLVNFLSIFGGILSMGLAGLFVGPLLASLIYGVIPILLKEWYSNEKNHR